MYGLKDLAEQCEFTNSDEVIKFLFLIHNKHTYVIQELLKCVTKDTTLGQCLEYDCNIEGNLQSVKLSKYVKKAQPSVSTTKVNVHANLNDVMSHQQGKLVGAVMVMRSPSVISMD